jgi:SAM-dependent methyltransferase
MCQSFGYFNPDDVYETTVSRLVTPETAWLDVGCGRDIFPSNRATAGLLANRCRLLAGLDPSDNILQNQFVHERHQTTIEDFQPDTQFDLVTLRMVAEHIAKPDEAVRSLGRLTRPGGRVVIYTVYRWSPITVLSSVVPFALHHRIKRLFWDGAEEDTFPTTYLMNTRRDLAKYFSANGFSEDSFQYCDDCRTTARWRFMSRLELTLWKCLNKLHLHYPEVCILSVYRRV